MSKYIDADEAIKALCRNSFPGFSKAVKIIKELPGTDAAPRWIPVTERLPEKYGQYLVTFIPSGGTLWTKVLIARYSDLMGIAKPSFHIGEVGKDSFVNINKQVIAWMPLPTPYKSGEEE